MAQPRPRFSPGPLVKKRGGHKHKPDSAWSQKHNLYRMAKAEIQEAYDTAHRDRERSEVVSLKESILLDLQRGEVLQRGLSYQRRFDIFNR